MIAVNHGFRTLCCYYQVVPDIHVVYLLHRPGTTKRKYTRVVPSMQLTLQMHAPNATQFKKIGPSPAGLHAPNAAPFDQVRPRPERESNVGLAMRCEEVAVGASRTTGSLTSHSEKTMHCCGVACANEQHE